MLQHMSRRPAMPTDPAVLAAFDRVFDDAVAKGPGNIVQYSLDRPVWEFVCHIADTREVVLHGSPNPDITRFEPRQPRDTTAFGNQKAVYAASDGLWPMYFAILDRSIHPMSTINASFRLADDEAPGEPYYFFSITRAALEKRAFGRGTIYFLPRKTFVQQPPEVHGGRRVAFAQWASLEPVTPLARIGVGPDDFPLLAEMRGHIDEIVFPRAVAEPHGFPWVD